MQTRDQGERRRDWKVIATIATVSALGISGLALADSSDRSDTPGSIDLEDRITITEVTTPKSTATTLADLGLDVATLDSASSPFDDSGTQTTVADSVASAASATTAVSAASPASAASPEAASAPSADSPDPAPADDSPVSAASAASAASAGSVDGSADS
jgi:hypothetical protein